MIMEISSTAIVPTFHWNTSIVWNLDNASQVYSTDKSNTTQESTGIGRLIRLATFPINIIFGTVGNLLILFVMQRGSLKKTPICFYMSVLAIADTGNIHWQTLGLFLEYFIPQQ